MTTDLLKSAHAGVKLLGRMLDPGRGIRIFLRAWMAYPRYLREARAYAALEGSEPITVGNLQPELLDRRRLTPFDAHYVYQEAWALRSIRESCVQRHVDIGSRVSFVGMLTAITEVIFVDIRPFVAELGRFQSVAGSIVALPFASDSVCSLSCLHVAEHVGLGRYGDMLDPHGTEQAIRELARVLAPGGRLHFSVPVGRPRVCFNAHRIHSPQQILHSFCDLELVQFAGVNDGGTYRREMDPSDLADATYACGLFHFTKKL